MTTRREAAVLMVLGWVLLISLLNGLLTVLLPALGIDSWEQQFWVAVTLGVLVGWLYIRFYVRPLRRRLERRDD